MIPSPVHKSFNTSKSPRNRGRKRLPSESIPHRAVWKPRLHWLIADWLGFAKPPDSGKYIRSHPQNKVPSICLRLQLKGNESCSPHRRYRPVTCGNPNCGHTIVGWVREASDLRPLRATGFSKFIDHDLAYYFL